MSHLIYQVPVSEAESSLSSFSQYRGAGRTPNAAPLVEWSEVVANPESRQEMDMSPSAREQRKRGSSLADSDVQGGAKPAVGHLEAPTPFLLPMASHPQGHTLESSLAPQGPDSPRPPPCFCSLGWAAPASKVLDVSRAACHLSRGWWEESIPLG